MTHGLTKRSIQQETRCAWKTLDSSDICDLSKGLAEVLKENRNRFVQLIHQSAMDFVVERGFHFLGNSLAGTMAGHGHFWLSRSRVEYFFVEEVQAFALRHRGMNITEAESKDGMALLDYSIK